MEMIFHTFCKSQRLHSCVTCRAWSIPEWLSPSCFLFFYIFLNMRRHSRGFFLYILQMKTLKWDGNTFKCTWVLNLRQHFRQWWLLTWMMQTPDSVKFEFDFLRGHLHTWVELQSSNDSQGTHSYFPIPHSVLFTAVKCLSLFIIYKIAGDFERFGAQAPVLAWHKGAEEEEEDAESPTLFPKACSNVPVMCRGCIPAHPTWKLHWWSHFPSHPEQVSDSITSSVLMEKGSSSVWTPLEGCGSIREEPVLHFAVQHTKLQLIWTAGKFSSAKSDNFTRTSHKNRGLEDY